MIKRTWAALYAAMLTSCAQVTVADHNEGSGGSCGPPTECQSDDDCSVPREHDCMSVRCREGRCETEVFAPDYTCHSPDPDGNAPSLPDSGEYHCYGGQCCYTCIADSGATPSKIDPSDGPCVAGTSDDYCGFGGGLCANCTIRGKVCREGSCILPDIP